MIRVLLPAHLRTLAKVRDEVSLPVAEPVTLGAVLDRLEAEYPMLCGTTRDFQSKKRRPFIRFFVCQEDWSHREWTVVLPEAVVRGQEPLLIVGAIAGG